MRRTTLLCLALLNIAGAEAAASDFLLGPDYSEWGPGPLGALQIATDGSGALYILSLCAPSALSSSPSCVTKLSADGKIILWQNNLGFLALAMAVDPNGGVYIIPEAPSLTSTEEEFSIFVEKLSADGASVLWKTQVGTMQLPAALFPVSLAVDSTGRAFVAGDGPVNNAFANGPYVVRLNPAGVVDAAFLNLPNVPVAVGVDPTGSDVVVGFSTSEGFSLARLALDGATWVALTLPEAVQSAAFAVAPNGDAVVYGSRLGENWSLQRIDPTGAVVFSKAISRAGLPPEGLALDAAGNAYILGNSGYFMYPVKNSLAPCGSVWLSVYAPDGSLLQTTYLQGPTSASGGLLAAGPGAAVFVLDPADEVFTPTQTGPFPEFPNGTESGSDALVHLSSNASAHTFALACVGNAATFGTGAIAPGEIVTLFGNGLGPQQGVQLTATLQNPFPTQAANVEVTFDGTPAPLLWVQNSQINLAVPWSVAGPATEVCVTYNNVPTNCLTWPVAEAAPGVFTVDGVYAAALNQDGTINSATNPAPLTSIVAIFATGFGPIDPPQADGTLVGLPLPVNVLPINLVEPPCSLFPGVPPCGAVTYNVAYGGPAPFLIAGASQVNFRASEAVGFDNNGPYLTVDTPSGKAFSNTFHIYVADQ